MPGSGKKEQEVTKIIVEGIEKALREKEGTSPEVVPPDRVKKNVEKGGKVEGDEKVPDFEPDKE